MGPPIARRHVGAAFESTRLCTQLGVGQQGPKPCPHAEIIAIGLRSGRIELAHEVQGLGDCLHVGEEQRSACQVVGQAN